MDTVEPKVDYRLLNAMSNMVLCSSCFQEGRTTPVPQLISNRHRIKNICQTCRNKALVKRGESIAQRMRLMGRRAKV